MAYEWLLDIGKSVLPAVAGAVISGSATNRAADTQAAAGEKALALQEKMYQESQQALAPYRKSGEAANAKLSQLMGLAPTDTNAYKTNLMSKYPALFSGVSGANQTAQQAPTQNAQLASTMERLRTDPNDMTPEAKQKRQRLHQLSIMKDMDGYQNEYTGGKFSLGDYINNINTGLDEQAVSGYSGGLGGVYSPTAKKAWEAVSQQTDNALRRPPETDYLGPLAVALMSGGIGLGASALAGPALAGSITPTMAATGAKAVGSIAPRLAKGLK